MCHHRLVPFFRRRRAELAPDWEDIVDARVAHWRGLDADERAHGADLLEEFVTSRRWEAARGFELTDEVRTVISALAALLVLGREEGIDAYQDVSTVIVHPRTMRRHQVEAGEVAGTLTEGDIDLLGEAHHRGPVLIAWDAARRDARHPERGRNVVLHELAHKLDMLDLLVDGTPPLPDAVSHHRWVEVCTREYELLRAGEGGHLLDPYGATDVGEFFAVATEAFFCLPGELAHHKPDLYGVLRDFYGQDPAHRPHHRLHPWS